LNGCIVLLVQLPNVGVWAGIEADPSALIVNVARRRNCQVRFFRGGFNDLFSDALPVMVVQRQPITMPRRYSMLRLSELRFHS
jgi:hypothetical protein